MAKPTTTPSVSRRTALAALGMSGIALSAGSRTAVAQNRPLDHSAHPLYGMWLALANPTLSEDPPYHGPSLFAADGTVLLLAPPSGREPNGIEFASSYMGTWEPYDDRTGHFTAVQIRSNSEGLLIGSVTVDGYPQVSEDGQSFIDDGSLVTVTIRDAAGAVVATIPPGTSSRPVTASRMSPGAPGFQESDATPT